MNRPFTALGALASLLALAMFAVSSSSRSTTVQPAKSARQRARVSRNAGRGNFVIVVPANATELEIDSDATGKELCWPGSLSEDSKQVDSLVPLATAPPGSLSAARIELADEIQATWLNPAPLDCLAHHDPAYDRLLYGTASTTVEPVQPTADPASLHVLDFDAECFDMFRELAGTINQPRAPQAAARRRPKHTQWHLPSAAGIGIVANQTRIWLTQQIEQIAAAWGAGGAVAGHAANQELSWGEYADMIDSAMEVESVKPVVAATSGKVATVRSGD